jgi:uncharacterized membrane protein
MNWGEFLLFVHVLGAFALVGATAIFWALILTAYRADRPSTILALAPAARLATGLVIVGTIITLVFGIWLALYDDEYEIFDFWIIGAIVLWVVATETGRRGGTHHAQEEPVLRALADSGRDEMTPEARTAVPNRTGIRFDLVSTVAVLLILILMIFKPGA